MTIINSQLPEFSLQSYHNDDFVEVSNKDLLGKWSVLFFYPADFTFVCPTELSDLADKHAQLEEMGVEVCAISTDTHFVHKAWHDASETIKQIKYHMLADPTAELSKAMGTYIEEAGLSTRATFVMDPEGVIKLAEYHDNSIGRNADELVRKIQAAQYVAANNGEVCPAKWSPGKETLTPGINLVGKL